MLCPAINHWTLSKRTSCVPQVRILYTDRDAKQSTGIVQGQHYSRSLGMPPNYTILPINLNKILSGNGLSHLTMKSSSSGSPFLSFIV